MAKKPKRFKIETEEEWRARALRSQADVIRTALTRGRQSVEDIRDALNRKGHDFTTEHVLAGLQSLEDDGLAFRGLSGAWWR